MTATAVPITGANTIVGYSVTVPFAEADVYTFSFPYLDKDNFEIVVNSETTLVRTTDYTFTSDYLIQLTASGVARLNVLYGAFTSAVTVIIRRRTLLTVRLVDYQDGATLTEADLDLAANQAFYLIQEVYDSQEIGTVSINPVDGNIDFDGAEIINVATPTSESSAATLGSVLDNVITPDYAEFGNYRDQRLVFESGNLYRANTDIPSAPAAIDLGDWDVVLTVAQLAQIATNTQDLIDHEAVSIAHGTTGAIVGTTDTQTLTNKTLTSPVVNTPTGIVKGDVGLGNVDNTSDVTKDAAATTLTNKTITSPTITSPSIATPSRLDAKQDTYADLVTYASSASNGQFCFATDQKLMYQVVDSLLAAVGGGGSGSLDTFLAEDFQSTVATDFTEGLALAPDAAGTGTFGGVLSDDATTNISGSNSLKYVGGVTSTNDFFINDADLSIDTKQVDNDMGVNFYYKYDGADGDIKFIALDQDDAVLTSDLDLLDAADTATRFSTSFYIPSGTTGIRYGFQVVLGASTKVFIVDDIELSMNPFVYKNLIDTENYRADTYAGFGSSAAYIPYYANVNNNTVGNTGVITNDSTDGFSFTATRNCTVNITVTSDTAASDEVGISLNSTQLGTGISTITAAHRLAMHVSVSGRAASASVEVEMEAGDVIRPHFSSAFTGTAVQSSINITATATTEHVVTPAKSNMTDWTDYTPTFTGFGTASAIDFSYRRVGAAMEIQGKFTSGTPTAVEGQITLPNSESIESSVPLRMAGILYRGNVSAVDNTTVLITGGDSFLNMGAIATSSNRLVAANGFDVVIASDVVSLFATVPIEGWSSDVTFLAAVPVQKVAYLKHNTTGGTGGGASSLNTNTTRVLNTIEGDSEIVSIDSNQFTLSAGKYELEWSAEFYAVSQTTTSIYNTTTSTVDIQGNSCYQGSNANTATGKGSLEITETSVFEFRQWTAAADSAGFGITSAILSGNPSTTDTYLTIKITKLR